MEPAICPNVILVLADSNFINLCQNPTEYIDTLKKRVIEKRAGDAVIYTITGKYGISNVDSAIPTLDINDRNKTAFSQTLENSHLFFDELMVISINAADPYLLAAQEVVTNLSKTSTRYGYTRK